MSGPDGGARRQNPTRPGAWIVLLVSAMAGSALATVAGRADVFTGRASATGRPVRDCKAVPNAVPDPSPPPPGNALHHVGHVPITPVVKNPTRTKVLGFTEYSTARDYVRQSPLLLPRLVESALERHGFKRARAIGFQDGDTVGGVEAFVLGSPAESAAFLREVVLGECRAGAARKLGPLPGVVNGVTFVYHHEYRPPFRAAFVVGDTAVRLYLCVCQDDPFADPYQVLDRWAHAVDRRMREAPV